jgi:hypothetical protein
VILKSALKQLIDGPVWRNDHMVLSDSTDNIFAMRDWVVQNFDISQATFNERFGIATELEYFQ